MASATLVIHLARSRQIFVIKDVKMSIRRNFLCLKCFRCGRSMRRTVSRESVRSLYGVEGGLSAGGTISISPGGGTSSGVSCVAGGHGATCAPVPIVTSLRRERDRVIRQSSQPEACLHCRHHHGSLTGIADIASDALRINGALNQFRQVSQLYQSRITNIPVCSFLH